jgi:ATP-dependent Clp protease ATP-binding subunit ClpC
MFERFTPRARHVVVLAQEEARSLRHHYIGVEHLLLGLLREEDGLAAQALLKAGVGNAVEVRAAVVKVLGLGEEPLGTQLPFTPSAKKALELSLREALSLGHEHIGTEHILLGLTRSDDRVVMGILAGYDVEIASIRDEVVRLVDSPGYDAAREQESAGAPATGRSGARPAFGLETGDVLSRANAAAASRNQREVDSGDLLHALAMDGNSIAGKALSRLSVERNALLRAIMEARRELPGREPESPSD